MTHTTWDGLPIATGSPQGSSIIVRRRTQNGWQYPVLHRATKGTGYQGHWAWTPPAGMRQPGEGAHTAALRELAEETGITEATIHPVDLARGHALWTATVGHDTTITLDHEHDRFEWLAAPDAATRCRPGLVAEGFATVEPMPDTDFIFTPGANHHDITVDQQNRGRITHHPVTNDAALLEYLGDPNAVTITCSLTDDSILANGLVPRLAWSYLRDILIPAYPNLTNVWIAIDPDDTTTIAAWGKAGFTCDGVTDIGVDGHKALAVIRLARWL